MIRLFADLLKLNFDQSNRISVTEIKFYFSNIPDDVIEQFLSAHGRNSEFQLQYGKLDVTTISWCEKEVSGKEILNCSVYPPFTRWVQSVSERVDNFNKESWSCLDIRDDIVNHWANYSTWKRMPIFLDGSLVGEKNEYRLVEGHTRLGVLIGLIRNKVLDENKTHKIWLGT